MYLLPSCVSTTNSKLFKSFNRVSTVALFSALKIE